MYLLSGLLLTLLLGASGLPSNEEKAFRPKLPIGFPPVSYPEDNAHTPERWKLGRRLFYDPVLSRDSSISCGSCHHAGHAFSDTVALSPGVESAPGVRNAPTLTNVAYHPYFTRDGGVKTLETQILVPIQEHNEFDFNIVLIAERLYRDSTYQRMSKLAYNRNPDPYVISRAIACFERTLVSGNSRYDQFLLSGNSSLLSRSERRGMELFFSERTQCSSCHSGFNFTSYEITNNGLYLHYADSGRKRLTNLESDRATFKVPTLRNVALTAPYMHDGSMPDLESVVAHYSAGGKNHPNRHPLIRPLDLSPKEQQDLVSFLRTLTDEEFVNNPHFTNPFTALNQD
ncbi:c-type cytochrome [bacterium SCSIO 12741]|nr:c-type cytochrome [bacterium SCSIO 12741]